MSFEIPTELEESELSSENGEVYLFQWLHSLEKAIESHPVEVVKVAQSTVESSIGNIVTASLPYPPPGRAIRNASSRCLVLLYGKGESRSLFDTLQRFLKVATDKTIERESSKVAAFWCFGELMANYGSQVMSFMSEIALISVKTFKSSSSPLLRYHAVIALKKSILAARKAVSDSSLKEIFKIMKQGLTDKSLAIQRASSEVLVALFGSGEKSMSVSDIETIVNICSKNLDSVDQITRQSHSLLVGHILAASQSNQASEDAKSMETSRRDAELNDDSSVSSQPQTTIAPSIFALTEMLSQLSTQFNKPHISRRAKIGIFGFYSDTLTNLGATFVEANYPAIVSHLMTEILTNVRPTTPHHETLLVQKLVGLLLRNVLGIRMLSEQGQISAIQELSNSYLKRWPAMMPGQMAPNSSVLVVSLLETANLLQQLGNAPPPVQMALSECLVTLLSHPSHSTRTTASRALRCFCDTTPLRLPSTLTLLTDSLQRDVGMLLLPSATQEINSRTLGHAWGLSFLISAIPQRPLYVSYEIGAKVLDMAIQLLKKSGEHDVKAAKTEVEVAWTLIASLMTLGPNFVRPHLPQLLVLWRNALPKPANKDVGPGNKRAFADWEFLLQVRESALGGILCFLRCNFSLVTLDVARRVSSVLGNALQFANGFIASPPLDESLASPSINGVTLQSREAMLRSRVYQCFAALGPSSLVDTMQLSLLRSVLSVFAGTEYQASSTLISISATTAFVGSIWQSIDGYAFGLTSIEFAVKEDEGTNQGEERESLLSALTKRPVIGSWEYDPTLLLCAFVDSSESLEPAPAVTSVVNASIGLFAQLFPLQDDSGAARILSELLEHRRSPKMERFIGRKMSTIVNSATAIVMALRRATELNSRSIRDVFSSAQVTSVISPFLQELLVDGDHVVRSAASESIGLLSGLAGTPFLTGQVKLLVDQVFNNRDSNARAGCALAFGAIHDYVGGLAAGPLLKTTVHVLMSLSNDPHPLVHFWALSALARVVNAASLAYAPFVSSTLGMLLKVYLMESHELEGGSIINSNSNGDLSTFPIACQIIDAIITVLGPDIQDSPRTRSLVLNLVHEFSLENDERISVEAIKCTQHFLMFAPEYIDISKWVQRFTLYLNSKQYPLKVASINALYQLVQRDALAMSKLGGDRLVENLFAMLDDDSSIEGVRDVIKSWLQQTVIHNPSAWIDLCQRIMSRNTASQRVADGLGQQGSRDDEGESLNVSQPNALQSHLTSRWRTQLFALQCLHRICSAVAQSGRQEQLDVVFAQKRGIPTTGLLVTRVADLIKMAFTASTAYVTEIRLEGLEVLKDVIRIFAAVPDPAYQDSLLLEQYQAPITAALTPAFSSDSTPEILASAIDACASFVGSGVIRDANRMGRILKLLTSALEQSKEQGMLSLGEANELSPNASAMLRISTVAAWAQLKIASSQRTYISEIIKPFRGILISLWISSLRDYASIRADSELLPDGSSAALDSSYSSLGKEVLLPKYYTNNWATILQAISTSMASGESMVLSAMDGHEPDSKSSTSERPTTRTNPTAFFFVIFGLIFETLAASKADSISTPSSSQPVVRSALQTLKYLVRPEYSGNAITEATLFEELSSLCYRMALTEPAIVLVDLLEMLGAMASCYSSNTFDDSNPLGLAASQDLCLKICTYIIRHSVMEPIIQGDAADKAAMIKAGFASMCTVGASVSPEHFEGFLGLALLLYSGLYLLLWNQKRITYPLTELLKDESPTDCVGPTLPVLKTLLELRNAPSTPPEGLGRLVHGMVSQCLLNIDQLRGRQGEVINKKIKNNLLAAVLILTSISHSTKVGLAVIEHTCFSITRTLLDVEELAPTASHCAKTLILSSISGRSVPFPYGKLLIPGLIEFVVTRIATLDSSTKSTGSQLAALGEIWRAFGALFKSFTQGDARIRLLGILLPTIGILLGSAGQSAQTQLVSMTVTQLLSFATTDPKAFKESTLKLDQATRELLEQAIRKQVGVSAAGSGTNANAAKPQISLRSF